jgi:bifunctional non-homologous end joining protein LigD
MGLAEYKKKRDFAKTPEPAGAEQRSGRFGFVIQKHAATRLHYDFRLELDGVLKSWAVPKGPSLDPNEKRLAAHVEDHPVEYADFEGIIPEAEYGGGTVIVWDRGTWVPHGDPREGYAKGRFSFDLRGEKLQGSFSLFRMKSRSGGGRREEDNWLLVKKKDEFAKPLAEGDILVERPESVVTGRSLDQVAEEKDRTWRSNKNRKKAPKLELPRGAKKTAMPAELKPELATLTEEPPSGPGWIYEIKLDGYRTLAFIKGGEIRLISRTGKEWTGPLEPIAAACADLGVENAILDGEVVAFAGDGTTSFQRLQNAFGEGRAGELAYHLFDLIHLDGRDLRGLPLIERKALLRALMERLPKKHKLVFSEHFEGDGRRIFENACKLGVEGVIAKKKDSVYLSKRTRDWLKIKCFRRQELVIGGYSDPEGSRTGIGALLVGYHDPARDGALIYAGKVGTGFTQESLAELARRLARLERKSSPFTGGPKPKAGIHFVQPKLVAEVAFSEWTDGGHLRHPSFQGLREDRPPAGVIREKPIEKPGYD